MFLFTLAQALEAVGAGAVVRGAATVGNRALEGFVTSRSFVNAVHETFDAVDVNRSGAMVVDIVTASL